MQIVSVAAALLSMVLSAMAPGVAVRSGHHCTQPVHRHLGIPASARASLYIYSTREDVDTFVEELKETLSFFAEVQGAM